ncbi:MAG: bifunctional UDP-N-acetylmuramoyl-tripeptide:D-alanyl-D-alanine ligase/alanine racemase [Bacteroidales bacterium]
MEITTREAALIAGGKLHGPGDLIIKDLVTDSRVKGFTEGQAFIAIKGSNHDGHDFISSLYNQGIRIFFVTALPVNIPDFGNASFILVGNTIDALQNLARYKRSLFNGTVYAVTGSAGKTIVKEWLAEVMGLAGNIVRSPKSYNSQIGVPLSVWKLDDHFGAGIFEAGISQPGEMDRLRDIIQPHTGIITNIGDAHGMNFSDNREKATEKLRLFLNCSKIIYCRDHEIVHECITGDSNLSAREIIDWSFSNRTAAVFARKEAKIPGQTSIFLTYKGVTHDFNIPFSDRASVENCITVATVCLASGIDPLLVKKGLSGLEPVAMRMQMKNGINRCVLVEDYYNSDPGSLGMALEYICSQNGRNHTLVLSDFVQSSRDEVELYSGVASLVLRFGIKKFIGIGKALERNSSLFPPGSRFFESTDEFISSFHQSDFNNEIILLKGARMFEFERISLLLEQQVHQTVLEINLDAISHNLNEFRKVLNPGTRVMAMVKAFAYGAGSAEIAAFLEYHRVDYLTVAYADEGVDLRKAGITLPIMVMNPEPSSFETIIRNNLEPELYSLPVFNSFRETASRHGLCDYPVHLKIDSGMHRLGFMQEDLDTLISLLLKSDSLKIRSVFTHLAASEDPSLDHFTHKQMKVYLDAAGRLREVTGYDFLKHALNSSGIPRFPRYQFDMVRPGIGIYGMISVPGLDLRQSGRFKTRVSQVKRIPAGDPVGYGCLDRSDHERDIAIVPVGYADGLNRKLGNRNGRLYLKSAFVPIVGNVCMDMCMIDVTGLNVREGDEAEIFGNMIPVSELAEKCGTIPYEIITSIPARVKRVFYRE